MSEHDSHKHAKFLRSVIRWLDVGYPQGVPGSDQVPLFALLSSTPLTTEQLHEVVANLKKSHPNPDDPINKGEISEFISKVTHYDAGRDNIIRVASTLAAAGWPLAGISVSAVAPDDEHAAAAEDIACRHDVAEGVSQS
ncbi:DUF3349 domain-containing protein [Mycobacterium numidiamassiliense]|uniref:DUF3349 domain-containing protein n=1 Tax=Mycobacterium numidiamassiliense TaxID=1841861 RepID=UPI00097E1300|nr:DUF3349 domain-containing protein [Mycobacterium numidiamassiliense]